MRKKLITDPDRVDAEIKHLRSISSRRWIGDRVVGIVHCSEKKGVRIQLKKN